MDKFLTRGLRQRMIRHGGDWREQTTDMIRGRWPTPAPSGTTLEAEECLGVGGKPYYFYVLRAEDSFGLIVFVLIESERAVWPSAAHGATPFDSGGLWWRKFVTSPPLDDDDRSEFFRRHDVPLAEWNSAFEGYVRTRHSTIVDYILGNAPGSENGQSSSPAISTAASNGKRAWTWEVRVPHALAAGRLVLRGICMKETARADYVDWLWRTSLTESESARIQQWLDDHALIPEEDESVVQTAEDWIVDNV